MEFAATTLGAAPKDLLSSSTFGLGAETIYVSPTSSWSELSVLCPSIYPYIPLGIMDTRTLTETMHCHKFMIEVARCLLAFGAPGHRLESQLTNTAKVLNLQAEFLLLPNVVFISFHDSDHSGLHVIKRTGSISLSQLRDTQHIYNQVVSLQASPEQGWRSLLLVESLPLPYSYRIRYSIAFFCGLVITLLAFDGSFLDAIIAGAASGCLAFLNFYMIGTEPIVARIFE